MESEVSTEFEILFVPAKGIQLSVSENRNQCCARAIFLNDDSGIVF
jgi:hypothetical protein